MRPRTLVAVFAHGDDETGVAPLLARCAREGARVHLILVTDGAEGTAHTSIARGPDLAREREAEARCAALALGIRPPVFLGFPDGALGHFNADPGLLHRLTERLHRELRRLRADALVTYGPEGATGHPDHRLVSSVLTQLVRAGAHGVTARLFYAGLPLAVFRAFGRRRRAGPAALVAETRHFTLRVRFAPEDLAAARRAMECHRTQFSAATVERLHHALAAAWKGRLPLAPALFPFSGSDLFG